tara:strand:- start:503 stop:685 length:183 start_codon:yes stop_codon:yes gene_type:complete
MFIGACCCYFLCNRRTTRTTSCRNQPWHRDPEELKIFKTNTKINDIFPARNFFVIKMALI